MTQMSFIGHWTGTLEVAIPETLGKAIAGKLSHVDHLDQLSSSLVADALGELINVVCGHALTAMAGENVTFTPGLPRVHREGPEEWNRLAGQEETVGVMSEGSPLLVRMVLEGADLEARRGRG